MGPVRSFMVMVDRVGTSLRLTGLSRPAEAVALDSASVEPPDPTIPDRTQP